MGFPCGFDDVDGDGVDGHYDPYDVTAIWMRNHHHGGWITAWWVHRGIVNQPFSAASEHVRQQTTTTTRTPPGDDYIARRIAELLTPGTSPRSDADRRAIAHDANHPARPRLSLVNDAVVDDAAEPDGDHTDEDETTGTTPEEIATGKRPAPG